MPVWYTGLRKLALFRRLRRVCLQSISLELEKSKSSVTLISSHFQIITSRMVPVIPYFVAMDLMQGECPIVTKHQCLVGFLPVISMFWTGTESKVLGKMKK